MIDNIELIKPLLHFDSDDDYYFLQILQRKKDVKADTNIKCIGSNNNSRLIKGYYVSSLKYLDDRYYEIQELCKLFNARAGICLNKRSYKSSSLNMMVRLAQTIQSHNYRNAKMWTNVAGVYYPISDKTWIIDIDKEDLLISKKIEVYINMQEPKGDKIIAHIPSKNGFHIITKPFNMYRFKEKFNVNVHKNNPTNLYII